MTRERDSSLVSRLPVSRMARESRATFVMMPPSSISTFHPLPALPILFLFLSLSSVKSRSTLLDSTSLDRNAGGDVARVREHTFHPLS